MRFRTSPRLPFEERWKELRWPPPPPASIRKPSTNPRPGPTPMERNGREPTSEKASLPVDENGYEIDLLALAGRAEQISKDYQTRTVERSLSRSYRAWRNEHAEASKYLARSCLARPFRAFSSPRLVPPCARTWPRPPPHLFSTEDVVNVRRRLTTTPCSRPQPR